MTEVYAAMFAPIIVMWITVMIAERVVYVFVRLARFIRKQV